MPSGPTLPAQGLPPSFTSLYRLFLRASSAAVLHHRAATRYIRPLWKPTFPQNPSLASSEKAQLEKWLCLWEQNVGRTLSLLSVSAQSRGLAHKLTRNLSFLNFGFQKYQERTHHGPPQYWDPHQQEYKPARPPQTARMAEGKSGLTLGRIEFRLRRA
ncbi:hypothetical protein BGW80DRAFT_1436146 [Lactifluus volemus]|nr:hypothetical protein BGW80DRAFT_1436146 [Lactifluus volemus]